MRFKEYITEASTPYTMSRKDMKIFFDTWNGIKKHVDPQFIKDLQKAKKFLWRGSNKFVDKFKQISPRVNRRPSDMDEHTQKKLDDLFQEGFGVKPRSQGVFTIGNDSEAENYGEPYMFFPHGKYKFIWSDRITDLYQDVNNKRLNKNEDDIYSEWLSNYGEGGNGQWEYKGMIINSELGNGVYRSEVEQNIMKDLDDPKEFDRNLLNWIPDKTVEEMELEWEDNLADYLHLYQTSDLPKAIKSGNEIMFLCKSYYLAHQDFLDPISQLLFHGGIQMELFPGFVGSIDYDMDPWKFERIENKSTKAEVDKNLKLHKWFGKKKKIRGQELI